MHHILASLEITISTHCSDLFFIVMEDMITLKFYSINNIYTVL